MQRSSFAAYILLLTLAWMQVYGAVRQTFGDEARARVEARHLRDQVRALKVARSLDREALLEFRQNVATLMPDALRTLGRGRAGYPVRALASVVSPGVIDDSTRAIIAQTLFERGKKLFEQKKYADSNKVFEQMTQRYSYTSYVIESYFLLAEGQYQIGELQSAVLTINHMIELFPQDEMSGFAMVRLGHIFQERNHNDQAVDVYKTVMRTFPQRDVAAQAKASLRGVEL